MTEYAVLEITDGTETGTVSLLNGPIYLADWKPAGGSYKNGGVFVDSPVQDYRYIVAKSKANIQERIDVSVAATSTVVSATLDKLTLLLEDASTYWATKRTAGRRVWLKVQARSEANPRYADIMTGFIPALNNPFAQPHIQPIDCGSGESMVVQDKVQILLERTDYYSTPPTETEALPLQAEYDYINLLREGDGGPEGIGRYHWTRRASVSVYFEKDSESSSENYIMRVKNGNALTYYGVYQQIFLENSSESFTVTARARAKVGDGRIIFRNESDATIGSGVAITSGAWTELTLSGNSSAAGYLRVCVEPNAQNDEVEIDWIHLKYTNDGNTTSRRPVGPDRDSPTAEDIIGNHDRIGNITHVFYYDDSAATWYGNLLFDTSGAEMDLVPSAVTPAVDDIIWFGSEYEADRKWNKNGAGTWMHAVFDVSQNAIPATAELLTNTGFETDTSGWEISSAVGSLDRVTSPVRTGSGAGRVGAMCSIPGLPAVVRSASYITFTESRGIFGAWLSAGNSLEYKFEWSTFRVGIEWYDSGSSLISTSYGSTETVEDNWGIYPFTESYKFFSVEDNAPVGTAKVKVFVEWSPYCTGVPTGDDYLRIDDLTLKATTATYTAQWVNSGGTEIESYEGWKDGTNYFKNTGTRTVSFPTTEATSATKNNILAKWIGMKFTAIPAGFTPPTLSAPPFITTKNYIEVSAADLLGDGPTDVMLKIRELTGPTSYTDYFDDVKFDAVTGATVPDTTSAIYAMDDTDVVGVCFQNVSIYPNSHIRRAILYVTPAGSSYSGTKELDLDIYVQSGSLSVWTANSEMGPGATGVSTTKVDWAHPSQGVWDKYDPGSISVDQASRAIAMDVTTLVQEATDGSLDYNGDIAFHIDNLISPGTGTLDWYSSNASTEQPVWGLYVEHVATRINMRRVFIGTRSVDRGADFMCNIPVTNQLIPDIEFDFIMDVPADYGFPQPLYSAVAGTGFERIGSMLIKSPRAHSYSGRFRVFLSGLWTHQDRIYLRYRAGTQSNFITSERVTTVDLGTSPSWHVATIDMGEIYIDPLLQPDEIEVQIWAESASALYSYIESIWFMPTDEWFGEFNIDGDDAGTGMMDHLQLTIDGISFPFTRPRAFLSELDTGNEIANVRSSATQLQLYPGKTQRMYFLTMLLKTPDYSWDSRQGLYAWPHAVLAVSAEKRTRYSSFR